MSILFPQMSLDAPGAASLSGGHLCPQPCGPRSQKGFRPPLVWERPTVTPLPAQLLGAPVRGELQSPCTVTGLSSREPGQVEQVEQVGPRLGPSAGRRQQEGAGKPGELDATI